MSPYELPGLVRLDIAQHPETISITGLGSPSASTVISTDTTPTAPSDLSSGTIGESISSQPSNLPVKSTGASISLSTEMGRFTRHKRFFFEDGNVTFLVDDVLYRVHRYFFCRDSKVFKTRLSRLLAQDASSLPVISLDNVKSEDLDAFLSVLYPIDFNALKEPSFEELTSILDLSTRWGFTSIRDMAIRCLKPQAPTLTPHQRLILGRKYGIDQWILPALQELCERPEPPTRDEAHLMGLEDVILVGSVREKVRTHALTASPGIMERIKAWGRVEPRERPLGVPTPVFTAPSPDPVGGAWTRGPNPEPAEPVANEWLSPPGADQRWGDNVGFMVEIEPSEYSPQSLQHPARNLPLVKRTIVRVELRPENFPGPIRM